VVQDGRICDARTKFGGVWIFEELVAKKTNFRPMRKFEKTRCSLARAPRMSFAHEILHAPGALKHLACKKVSDFFYFTVHRV
jgi:hypothetical protein